MGRPKGIPSKLQIEKTCAICNQQFIAPTNKKKFCSIECKVKHRATECRTSCNWCQKDFPISKDRLNKAKDYFCSNKCANLYQGRKKVEVTCSSCNQVFFRSKSMTGIHQHQFCSSRCKQEYKKFTIPEHIGYSLLQSLNLEFECQKVLFGNIWVDAYIPEYNLIVEFDGNFWHSHPSLVENGQVFPEYQDRKKKNLDRNAKIKRFKYNVVRLWESDLKQNIEDCKAKIVDAIEGIKARKISENDRWESLDKDNLILLLKGILSESKQFYEEHEEIKSVPVKYRGRAFDNAHSVVEKIYTLLSKYN